MICKYATLSKDTTVKWTRLIKRYYGNATQHRFVGHYHIFLIVTKYSTISIAMFFHCEKKSDQRIISPIK